MIAIVTVETVLGAACIVVGAVAGLTTDAPPAFSVPLWLAIDASGASFLFVGLVRDLWLLVKARRAGRSARRERTGPEKPICLESLLGSLVVAVGLVFLALGVRHGFEPGWPGVAIWAGVLLVLSGLVKDVVLVFRIEKDHGNVILW